MISLLKNIYNNTNTFTKIENTSVLERLKKIFIFLFGILTLFFIFKNIPYAGDLDSNVIKNFNGIANTVNAVKVQ